MDDMPRRVATPRQHAMMTGHHNMVALTFQKRAAQLDNSV
jgi:hypothetical protein